MGMQTLHLVWRGKKKTCHEILPLSYASLNTCDYFKWPCFVSLVANLQFRKYFEKRKSMENPVETELEYIFFFKILAGYVF